MAKKPDETTPRHALTAGARTPSLDADRPIKRSTDDRFGRAAFATVVAHHVGSAADGQSLVFALVGPWGAGKTSVLNMTEERLVEAGVEVVWFNPWMFTGTEQIATQFMRELAVHLGSKASSFGRVGEYIETYGRLLEVGGSAFALSALAAGLPAWSVIPGLASAGLASAVGNAFKSVPRESVRETRQRVEKALRDAGRRIVIVVDDIDRLDGDEIRLMFKMVRLVADFPNVSYVLAFDRPRVERALGNEDMTGRAYLAKIVQASFDLPPLDPDILARLLPKELERCLSGRLHGPFHVRAWQDIFVRVVRPLIKHPRDVSRYLNAVLPAVDMLGEEVALEDTLALEGVRVFLPDVYAAIADYADVLSMGAHGIGADRHGGERDAAATRVKTFFKLGGDQEKVVRDLCKLVFPMSRFAIDNHLFDGSWLRRWRRSRRVACAEVLNVYLERGVRHGAARAAGLRRLVDGFGDELAVDQMLAELSAEELESTLAGLEDHAADLAKIAFENGFVAVLRHADRLRLGRGQPFDFGADLVVSRLILSTLRNVQDRGRRVEAVCAIVARTQSFTWRADVLRLVQRHDDDEPLIDEAVASAMSASLKSEVLASTPERLAVEREPYLVARMAHDDTTKTFDTRLRSFLEHADFVRAFLASLVSEAMSWGLDSVALKVTPNLPWTSLKTVAGGDDALRTMFRLALDGGPAPEGNARLAQALQLVQAVLDGENDMTERGGRDDDGDDDD